MFVCMCVCRQNNEQDLAGLVVLWGSGGFWWKMTKMTKMAKMAKIAKMAKMAKIAKMA